MTATPRTLDVSPEAIKGRVRAEIRKAHGEATPILSGEGVPDVWIMDDLQYRPKPNWLIDQVVEEKGLTIFFGPDKVGKTAMLSSFLWAWADGKDHWFDPTFKMSNTVDNDDRRVLYVLLEGQAAFYERYDAWRTAYAGDNRLDNFFVIDEGLSLFEPRMRWDSPETWTNSAKGLYRAVEELKPQILVIDTLSRATAGMDENSPQMAQVVGFLDQLRDEFGVASIIVHHVALSEGSRPRGHSSLKGAASSYVRVEGEPDKSMGKLVVGPHRNAASENGNGWYFDKVTRRASFIIERTGKDAVSRTHSKSKQLYDLVVKDGPFTVEEAADFIYKDKGKSKLVYGLVTSSPELVVKNGIVLFREIPEEI